MFVVFDCDSVVDVIVVGSKPGESCRVSLVTMGELITEGRTSHGYVVLKLRVRGEQANWSGIVKWTDLCIADSDRLEHLGVLQRRRHRAVSRDESGFRALGDRPDARGVIAGVDIAGLRRRS